MIRICFWAPPRDAPSRGGPDPGSGRAAYSWPVRGAGAPPPQIGVEYPPHLMRLSSPKFRRPCARHAAAPPQRTRTGHPAVVLSQGQRMAYAATQSRAGRLAVHGTSPGGLWVGTGHKPRWDRIFSITSACSMNAMIRIDPPHWVQTSGSTS